MRVFHFQREGTFFGFDEAKRNVGNIVEGLRRSSDRLDVEDMLADEVCHHTSCACVHVHRGSSQRLDSMNERASERTNGLFAFITLVLV